MSGTPNLRQNHFRFRTGTDNADTGPWTWLAAEDANYYPGTDTNFRIRFALDNTGTAGPATNCQLRYSLNGAAYVSVTTTSNVIRSVDASTSTDDSNIATANFKLTAGSGTATIGRYDENGSTGNKTPSAGNYTEVEFGIVLRSADVANGDTIDLRCFDATTAYTTYNQTPRITVPTANLPVGKSFIDLSPRDYPPPGQTWTWQYNQNLIAKDRMIVGKQVTDLSPIGPAYPQQLRTWAQSLLQSTLAPIPQIPPGEQFYVLPPVGPQQPIPIWTRSYNPNLIAQDAMVTGEQITDLPPRAYPEPATRTWAWSYNLNLIGKDRLTVGEQLYELPPKGPEQPLRRWEWSYNLNLIGKDQLPVGEQSIALPPIGYEYPQGLRTWIQSLQQSTLAPVVAAPFSQSDWPVSYGPTQPLRSWTWSYNLNLIGKDALPIGEQRTELPPTGYIYPNDIRTWINRVNLALTTQAAKLPFNQYDWPNPRAHQQPDRSWFRSYNLNLIGKDRLPAGKRVTDLPPRAYPEPATRTWTYSFNLNLRGKDQILVGKQLTDLPPRDYLRPTQVRTWTHSYNLNLIGKDKLPVGAQVTGLPTRLTPIAVKTWINAVNLNLAVTPTTLPFNQYDWPIYRDLSYPTDNRSWINACNLNLGIPVYISPIPPVPPPTPPTDSRIAYNAGNEWQIFDRIREPGPIGWR